MHNSDCMLSRGAISDRGIVYLGADLVVISELMENARLLQKEGMQLKLNGEHRAAVQVYKQLLETVRALDELGAFSWPRGLSAQLVQRAIELEEDDGKCPFVSQSQLPPPVQ